MNKLSLFNITLFFGIILTVLLVPTISAEYSPHKLNQQLEFSITSNNATECNITTYDYPNGTVFINQNMTRNGNTFNGSIESGNFTSIGNYCFNIVCNDSIYIETGSVCREVTPSGSQINSGKSISLFGSIFVMLIISVILFIIGFKTESNVAKISFYSFSGLSFIMTILYTIVIMQQTLFGFDSILTGIDTFWTVAKTFIWIGFLGFGVVILLIMMKAWKIKRGLVDID